MFKSAGSEDAADRKWMQTVGMQSPLRAERPQCGNSSQGSLTQLMRGQSEGDGIPVRVKQSGHPAVGKQLGMIQKSHLNQSISGIKTHLTIFILLK